MATGLLKCMPGLLATRSRGDLLVYLTQDAIPTSDDWLSKLALNFRDPRVGAAYCRNVPRPDCRLPAYCSRCVLEPPTGRRASCAPY